MRQPYVMKFCLPPPEHVSHMPWTTQSRCEFVPAPVVLRYGKNSAGTVPVNGWVGLVYHSPP